MPVPPAKCATKALKGRADRLTAAMLHGRWRWTLRGRVAVSSGGTPSFLQILASATSDIPSRLATVRMRLGPDVVVEGVEFAGHGAFRGKKPYETLRGLLASTRKRSAKGATSQFPASPLREWKHNKDECVPQGVRDDPRPK